MLDEWIQTLQAGDCLAERDLKKLCLMVRGAGVKSRSIQYSSTAVSSVLMLLLLYQYAVCSSLCVSSLTHNVPGIVCCCCCCGMVLDVHTSYEVRTVDY